MIFAYYIPYLFLWFMLNSNVSTFQLQRRFDPNINALIHPLPQTEQEIDEHLVCTEGLGNDDPIDWQDCFAAAQDYSGFTGISPEVLLINRGSDLARSPDLQDKPGEQLIAPVAFFSGSTCALTLLMIGDEKLTGKSDVVAAVQSLNSSCNDNGSTGGGLKSLYDGAVTVYIGGKNSILDLAPKENWTVWPSSGLYQKPKPVVCTPADIGIQNITVNDCHEAALFHSAVVPSRLLTLVDRKYLENQNDIPSPTTSGQNLLREDLFAAVDEVAFQYVQDIQSALPQDLSMHLILTGATGLVGSGVLHHMLNNNTVTTVSILSRRPVPMAEGHEKAKVIIHKDFKSFPSDLLEQLKGATGCVWALGVNQNDVDKELYQEITVDYPIAAAKAFSTLSDPFTFVYVSGEGATTTPSRLTPHFGRVKGIAESSLLALPKDAQFRSLNPYSARPGGVDAQMHPEIHKYMPKMKGMKSFYAPPVFVAMRTLLPGQLSPTRELGKVLTELAMRDRGTLGVGKEGVEGKGVSGEGRTVGNAWLRSEAGL
ncbi:uncharacterized protein KY384_003992 [Bacidia gigantensis]|uniref:uncharacterized protein n=1 Tax=Bacidia gigantensis TaxID=2732470 RepID=UPI001D045204|nr:uncharacterized protein KY384_003992 [Bacidia gigantensis]KAG8531281.1 hypothetical protein KY384_003992 [Bacidia gigantensis]